MSSVGGRMGYGYGQGRPSDEKEVTVREILQEAGAPVTGGCFERCEKAIAWLGNVSVGSMALFLVPKAEDVVTCTGSGARACRGM